MLAKRIPQDFHNEFAAWVRLEPRARSNDIARGLEARVADPLWLLARQWQMGELDGEDAGSPIEAVLAYSTQALDRLALGGVDGPAPAIPLEAAVECEPAPLDWRFRIQIGQQFERLARSRLNETPAARDALLESVRALFPVEVVSDTDRATQRFLNVFAGRVTDGGELLRAIREGTLAAPAGVSAQQLEGVVKALTNWLGALMVQPDAGAARAWRSEQLHYCFDLNPPPPNTPPPPDRIGLRAPDYRNGDLDWYSFSALTGKVGAWTAPPPNETVTVYPTRIGIAGTSPRWWAFEDAAADFGGIDVSAPDLAKLLLIEFVLIYGDDWFSIPLTLRMPRLVQIDSLNVRNAFPELATPIPSVASLNTNPSETQRWEVFALTLDDPSASAKQQPGLPNVLLVPPVAGFREESESLEEVHFLRDEGANMVWGVEDRIMNGVGRSVSGFDAQRERAERERARSGTAAATPAAPAPQGSAPLYRLATTVPDNWIPFTPASVLRLLRGDVETRVTRLQRAQMLRNSAHEEPSEIPAMSSLLTLRRLDPLHYLEEAAVLRAGLRVQLTAQRARSSDGKTYVWLGRKVLVGGGEGASGLRFDVLRSS